MTKRGLYATLFVTLALGIAGHPVSAAHQTKTAQSQPAPGTSAGTAIGNAISTAIGIAFPPAEKIIQAIWGSKTSDKVKGTEAQSKVVALQKPAVAQLTQLSSDLSVVATFVVDCMEADRHMIVMQQILSGPAIALDQGSLQAEWNFVKPRLQELGSDSTKSQAAAVSDEYIRRSLLAIYEASKYGEVQNIDTAVQGKGYSALKPLLSDLEPKLASVMAISGDVITEASSGLSAAAKNMAPSGGSDTQNEQQFKEKIGGLRKAFAEQIRATYKVEAPQP